MSTLFVEAFGRLSGPSIIDCEEEDLYSVFLTRSELMGWGAPSSDERPLLWHMEEAEITADADSDRIGYVQVGLGVGPLEPTEPPPRPGWAALPVRPKSTDPVLALPPLVQRFGDSLDRFGDIEVSFFQVTATYLNIDPVSQLGHLVSMLNWFNTNLNERADAIISFEQNLLGGRNVSELIAECSGMGTRQRHRRSTRHRAIPGKLRRPNNTANSRPRDTCITPSLRAERGKCCSIRTFRHLYVAKGRKTVQSESQT